MVTHDETPRFFIRNVLHHQAVAQQYMETPSGHAEDSQKEDASGNCGNEVPIKPNELPYGLGQPWGGKVPHRGGHHGINLYWLLPCWVLDPSLEMYP